MITGALGLNSSLLNGVYLPLHSAPNYHGRQLLRKREDPDIWLRFVHRSHPDKVRRYWVVSATADKDADNDRGFAHCIDTDLQSPVDATRWAVWSVAGQRFEEQESLSVQPFDSKTTPLPDLARDSLSPATDRH